MGGQLKPSPETGDKNASLNVPPKKWGWQVGLLPSFLGVFAYFQGRVPVSFRECTLRSHNHGSVEHGCI